MASGEMDDIPVVINVGRPRLFDQIRFLMRRRNMAYATEKTYLLWIRSFIRFHGKRHPADMGAKEVDEFLSWLAVKRRVAPGTQAVALNALVFLYHRFFEVELGELEFSRPKPRRSVPQVLTHQEAISIIRRLRAPFRLMAALMYGTGVRSMECCRLRIKDIDFGMSEIVVRDGKGGKDRRTILPQSLKAGLKRQIAKVDSLHRYDLAHQYGGVVSPID